MPLHLIKLCVGADTIDDLAHWQAGLVAAGEGAHHDTRMTPKRAEEVLAGGSLYWVIRRRIVVRQRILALESMTDSDNRRFCRIRLDARLVPTRPRTKRPFQGWRYLEAKSAPPDLVGATIDGAGEAALEQALKEALVW
jgi:hypothetical protein